MKSKFSKLLMFALIIFAISTTSCKEDDPLSNKNSIQKKDCELRNIGYVNFLSYEDEPFNLYDGQILIGTISAGAIAKFEASPGPHNYSIKEINYILIQTTYTSSVTVVQCATNNISFGN